MLASCGGRRNRNCFYANPMGLGDSLLGSSGAQLLRFRRGGVDDTAAAANWLGNRMKLNQKGFPDDGMCSEANLLSEMDEATVSIAAMGGDTFGSRLRGRHVAFIGKLASMKHREAAELVAAEGGVVVERSHVPLDLLVVGGDRAERVKAMDRVEPRHLQMQSDGQLEIVEETEFWQRLGLVNVDASVHSLYTPAMVASLAGVPLATIRRWQRRGLIRPRRSVHRLAYFDFPEVATARRLAELLQQGASPRSLETSLSRLGSEMARPLSQLEVVVEGKSILLREGQQLMEPGGQQRIDFEALVEASCELETDSANSMESAESEGPRTVALRKPAAPVSRMLDATDSSSRPPEAQDGIDGDTVSWMELDRDAASVESRRFNAASGSLPEADDRVSSPNQAEDRDNSQVADLALDQLKTADQFLALAMAFEDEGENSQAMEIYRSMQLALGPTPEVCFQLAELLYFESQFEAARERYSMAIELDESFVEARANLGCVFIELGQFDLAEHAFRGALRYHEQYPDVHFHLARTLDKMEKDDDAEVHWRRFLELSPNSPWASEAKDRLSGLGDS